MREIIIYIALLVGILGLAHNAKSITKINENVSALENKIENKMKEIEKEMEEETFPEW